MTRTMMKFAEALSLPCYKHNKKAGQPCGLSDPEFGVQEPIVCLDRGDWSESDGCLHGMLKYACPDCKDQA